MSLVLPRHSGHLGLSIHAAGERAWRTAPGDAGAPRDPGHPGKGTGFPSWRAKSHTVPHQCIGFTRPGRSILLRLLPNLTPITIPPRTSPCLVLHRPNVPHEASYVFRAGVRDGRVGQTTGTMVAARASNARTPKPTRVQRAGRVSPAPVGHPAHQPLGALTHACNHRPFTPNNSPERSRSRPHDICQLPPRAASRRPPSVAGPTPRQSQVWLHCVRTYTGTLAVAHELHTKPRSIRPWPRSTTPSQPRRVVSAAAAAVPCTGARAPDPAGHPDGAHHTHRHSHRHHMLCPHRRCCWHSPPPPPRQRPLSLRALDLLPRHTRADATPRRRAVPPCAAPATPRRTPRHRHTLIPGAAP